MKAIFTGKTFLIVLFFAVAIAVYFFTATNKPVDFNTQVKPIFNKKCITCHGGVRRKAGFSLLFRSEALMKNESGKPAIIPGDPDHSEMIRRLTLKDPEERMPYKHEALSKDEIGILRRWIKEGARWGDHWAYVAVAPVEVPARTEWSKNDIDNFLHHPKQIKQHY
jgi:mono/diheme cytochrome c family protein